MARKCESYYAGAQDALKTVDNYLHTVYLTTRGKTRKLVDDIGWAVETISTELGVENAKRRGDWPKGD